MEQGFVYPSRLQFTPERVAQVRAVAPERLKELQDLDRRHAEIYRDHPFLPVPDQVARLRAILDDPRFRREVDGEGRRRT